MDYKNKIYERAISKFDLKVNDERRDGMQPIPKCSLPRESELLWLRDPRILGFTADDFHSLLKGGAAAMQPLSVHFPRKSISPQTTIFFLILPSLSLVDTRRLLGRWSENVSLFVWFGLSIVV